MAQRGPRWTESKVYRGEPVGEDPGLPPEDKETVIAFNKRDTRALVLSWEAPIIKRLLALPHFEIRRLRLLDGKVVYVEGTVPVATLKILAIPRRSLSHAELVARTPGEDHGRVRSHASLMEQKSAPGEEGRINPLSQCSEEKEGLSGSMALFADV